MSDGDLQRTIGRLEQAVLTLTREMAEQKSELAEIRETLQQARGGWRLLMFLGGGAATVGAAIGAQLARLWAH